VTTSLAHDPTTGFHDIKALPEFIIVSDFTVWILLAIVLATALFLLILKNKKKALPSKGNPLKPEHIAFSTLREIERGLRANEITVRHFTGSLSLTIRTFLESALGFAAVESTTTEVVSRLKHACTKVMPRLASSKVEELILKSKSLLLFCDKVTFGDNTEQSYNPNSEEFATNLQLAREIISHIADQIIREQAANMTVADHSKATINKKGGSANAS